MRKNFYQEPFSLDKVIINDDYLTPEERFVYTKLLYTEKIRDGKKVLEKKPEVIAMDFEEIYPTDEIMEDLDEIRRIKEKFKERLLSYDHDSEEEKEKKKRKRTSKKRAKIFELITAQEIELADWFGNDCYAITTVEYDDIKNRSDLIIEWPGDDFGPIRIAVDVTTSEDKDVISKKFDNIRLNLKNNKGTRIKYFYPGKKIDKKIGNIENLPHVVLIMNGESVRGLCELVAKIFKDEKGVNLILAEHSIQIDILEEILKQINLQIACIKNDFLLKKSKNINSPLYDNLNRAAEKIEEILENKKSSSRIANRDGAYEGKFRITPVDVALTGLV